MIFEQQTEATLQEAIIEFEKLQFHKAGSCLFLNEIGIMAVNGDVEAEAYLRTVIEKEELDMSSQVAYFYLKHALKTPSPETVTFIDNFNTPSHERFIKIVANRAAKIIGS